MSSDGAGGGSTGDLMEGDDACNVIMSNGQPAAVLISLIVYSTDGVALGVVSDIASFGGTNMRLALFAQQLARPAQNPVLINVPVSRLTQFELRLSITAAEFVRTDSA